MVIGRAVANPKTDSHWREIGADVIDIDGTRRVCNADERGGEKRCVDSELSWKELKLKQ